MSLTLDPPIASASLADIALEQMPYPVVILDGELRVRRANAEARTRLEPPSEEEDPCPPFDTVLARSGRIPTDVRLHILSCCGAEVRGQHAPGEHDTVFALAPGHTIAPGHLATTAGWSCLKNAAAAPILMPTPTPRGTATTAIR